MNRQNPNRSPAERLHNRLKQRVTIGPIIPIGPWCGYWWNHYPSGYRVELEVELRK